MEKFGGIQMFLYFCARNVPHEGDKGTINEMV